MDTRDMLVSVEQALVPFYGSKIFGVRLPDNRIAGGFSSLCKMLSLAKHGQVERIRRNKDLAQHLLLILVETPSGLRRMDVLIAEAIRPWVMGIQINLIAPEKRPLINALKEHAYEMLSRALLKPEAEEVAESAPEWQAVPPPRIVPDEPGVASDSPWDRLFEAQHISQEALRDIRQQAEQQTRDYRSLAGRMVVFEEWLMSLDRRVATIQGDAAGAEPPQTLSAAHLLDMRTLFRLLEQTTGRPQAQLMQELIETFRVLAINAILDEQWPDVLTWCWWRAQQP
jgi:hypothetical protein